MTRILKPKFPRKLKFQSIRWYGGAPKKTAVKLHFDLEKQPQPSIFKHKFGVPITTKKPWPTPQKTGSS